jgi:uncharacterized LabA/DUF88 family protein
MRILFIDGENFKYKAREAVGESDQRELNWTSYNFDGLFQKVLNGIYLDEKRFYYARLKMHPDTKQKSQKLIEEQRALLLNIRNQGFTPCSSGSVRGRYEKNAKNESNVLVFREKGVDVRIAVDMVLAACDGRLKEIYLCSSDSDLQPAIRALRDKKIKVVYVGFQTNPNVGIQKTTHESFLIRSSEIIEFAK